MFKKENDIEEKKMMETQKVFLIQTRRYHLLGFY
jgi:hypothetical protein